MKHYDIKIRVAGSPLNEVNKAAVSAGEIAVLRALHGADAVDLLKDAKAPEGAPKSQTDLKTALAEKYGDGVLTATFGVQGTLPTEAGQTEHEQDEATMRELIREEERAKLLEEMASKTNAEKRAETNAKPLKQAQADAQKMADAEGVKAEADAKAKAEADAKAAME